MQIFAGRPAKAAPAAAEQLSATPESRACILKLLETVFAKERKQVGGTCPGSAWTNSVVVEPIVEGLQAVAAVAGLAPSVIQLSTTAKMANNQTRKTFQTIAQTVALTSDRKFGTKGEGIRTKPFAHPIDDVSPKANTKPTKRYLSAHG